jgi:hypothetical protein
VNDEHKVHGLVGCDCGTVMFDCGCRLRLVETRQAACQACRASARMLLEWRRDLCAPHTPRVDVGRD